MRKHSPFLGSLSNDVDKEPVFIEKISKINYSISMDDYYRIIINIEIHPFNKDIFLCLHLRGSY